MEFDKLSARDYSEFYAAAKENIFQPTGRAFYKQIFSMLGGEKEISPGNERREKWAWKEPNTQIYVREILNHFQGLKYIHVLRHGLDMAFSNNLQQLKNWGWKYGIKISKDDNQETLILKQLDYWNATTKEILQLKEEYNDQIFIVNFGELCMNPKRGVDHLLSFCDIEPSSDALEDIYEIPRFTPSINRYRRYDISRFSKDQLEIIKAMGFPID